MLPPGKRITFGFRFFRWFINTGSVTICDIQMFAFCPNTEEGTLVMIFEASIFTKALGASVGIVAAVYSGIVKFLGCQLSRKNPIVASTDGSVGVATTVVSVPPLFPTG